MKIIKSKLLKTDIILVIGVLVAMVVIGCTSGSAHAESSSANASVTVANTISLSLTGGDLVINNLTPGSASDSNVITASVTSNSPYGFHLSATTGTSGGTTSLVNTADSNFTFANLDSNKASLANFSDNTWGYSYSENGSSWISGDYGAGATAGYNGLPLDGNDNGDSGVVLFNSDSYLGSKSMQFKIGAKSATTQAAGTYTNTVNFYAVANSAPVSFDDAYAAAGKSKVGGYYSIQDATSSICTSVTKGQIGQVIDTRDNTVYHIGKLADDRCWMLDNLALDLVSKMNDLSENDTNASNATLGYLKNGGGSVVESDPTYHFASSTLVNLPYGGYSAPAVDMQSKDVVPSDSMSTSGGYKVGGYYNYCAASAGSYCYGDGWNEGVSSGNAMEDLCPKGWKIPSYEGDYSYSALAIALSGSNVINDSTMYNAFRVAFRLPLSGYFPSESASSQGSEGWFWSSTRDSNRNMRILYLSTSVIASPGSTDRREGASIRCILTP